MVDQVAPRTTPGGAEDRRELEELREALVQRTLIARAQGVLMERYDLGEGAAIALLKRISMQTQVKVHDLAAQVLAGVALEELQRPGLACPSPGARTTEPGGGAEEAPRRSWTPGTSSAK